ncbi:hypothetical protein, partial [Okeania sp. SIO2B9]|uniref:hypothetical protein n=1 Tax=Okeania sp. SIO2B9 TaxID=2607782 RepID=UPI00142C70FC
YFSSGVRSQESGVRSQQSGGKKEGKGIGRGGKGESFLVVSGERSSMALLSRHDIKGKKQYKCSFNLLKKLGL